MTDRQVPGGVRKLVGPLLAAGVACAAQTASAQAPSRAQQLMGDVAPKLAELTDEVLLGDVWERPGLSKRDRSLVTVSALVALNRPEQLRSHIALARRNGVTEAEIVEAITQLAFYSGWPNAITAVGVAREVFRTEPGGAKETQK
ncbi:MAG: carboxymuconolactone decarboxylase family protein [Phenylobacterium sp.]